MGPHPTRARARFQSGSSWGWEGLPRKWRTDAVLAEDATEHAGWLQRNWRRTTVLSSPDDNALTGNPACPDANVVFPTDCGLRRFRTIETSSVGGNLRNHLAQGTEARCVLKCHEPILQTGAVCGPLLRTTIFTA